MFKGTRLGITLYYARSKFKSTIRPKDDWLVPLGWVNINLVNFKGHFVSGRVTRRLWPNEKANPIGTCVENIKTPNPIILTLELSSFSAYHPTPVVFTPLVVGEEGTHKLLHFINLYSVQLNKYSIPEPPGRDELLHLNKIVNEDPLYRLTDGIHNHFIWLTIYL
jgi:hypothetical protein